MRRPYSTVLTVNAIVLLVSGCSGIRSEPLQTEPAERPPAQVNERQTTVQRLEERINDLSALLPGQGAVMSLVGYYFGNLWFAINAENWPLAEFYLHECRETLERAVDIKPIRQDLAGLDVDLVAMAEALDHTQFTQMDATIRAEDKAGSISVYREAMIVCYSCHMSTGKPFLNVRIPATPSSIGIEFDPSAPPPK
ncbi:MAG: hypothetical protein IH897_15835 [Planctomycetes bacterium]|nr:hypothetical protein [Planctomycetota bacterium]